MNSTNHNTLFTAKNEERFLKTFERLVDHIVKTKPTPEVQGWLDKANAHTDKSNALNSREKMLAKEVSKLEKILNSTERQLAEANAKLSRRF